MEFYHERIFPAWFPPSDDRYLMIDNILIESLHLRALIEN